MKLLSIIYSDDGRKLKQLSQGLLKSGACNSVLVTNYVHQYRTGEGKGLHKTQHKLIQIQFEESTKLVIMLNKLYPDWTQNYRVQDIYHIH